MSIQRRLLIAANWKKNMSPKETKKFLKQLKKKSLKKGIPTGIDIIIAPPAISISTAYKHCHKDVFLAGQNCSAFDGSADTGEISPKMFGEIGCDYIIVGHSERRERYSDDDIVNDKVRAVLDSNMYPLLCVGETLEERNRGDLETILSEQLEMALQGVSGADIENIVIAYEPVWAIGTGKTATPKEAQEAHAYVRSVISDLYTAAIAESIHILYGGSMNPENAEELLSQSDIDGGLIGGASLGHKSFGSIIRTAGSLKE